MTDLVEVTNERPKAEGEYSPSVIRFYGQHCTTYSGRRIKLDIGVQNPGQHDLVLVYGYAYQGHCYTLPEPMLLALPRAGRRGPAEGCGFDGRLGYEMWRVDKLEESVMLHFSADTLDQLVLMRNLPGTRQPLSYAGKVQMLHRGGKLTD